MAAKESVLIVERHSGVSISYNWQKASREGTKMLSILGGGSGIAPAVESVLHKQSQGDA